MVGIGEKESVGGGVDMGGGDDEVRWKGLEGRGVGRISVGGGWMAADILVVEVGIEVLEDG